MTKPASIARRASARFCGALGLLALLVPACVAEAPEESSSLAGELEGARGPGEGVASSGTNGTETLLQAWAPGAEEYDIEVIRDIPITMPDGRVLRGEVQNPIDRVTRKPAAGPFPILLSFTPYGKSVTSPTNPYFVKRGYIGVAVDVAGTGGSEGKMELFSKLEAEDSKNIIDWAAALPRSNGKVGTTGLSYLAITQLFAAAAVGPNSPLKAIFPIASSVDPYRDLFVSGGLVNLESSLGLIVGYAGVRTVTPVAERPWDLLDAFRLAFEHGAQAIPFEAQTAMDVLVEGERRFDGPYWQERAPGRVLTEIVKNDVAVHLVAGLYDVFQRGNALIYSGLQNAAAGRPVDAPMIPGQPVDPRFQMLFGPWDHGNQGAGLDLNALQLRWFDRWLKGQATGIDETSTPIHVIEPGGASYHAASYPVETTKPTRFYFDDGAKLSTAPPKSNGSDRLVYTGLSNLCTRSTQQFSAGIIPGNVCGGIQYLPGPGIGRIGYTSEPLDKPMKLAGPIGVTIQATSTRPDAIFVVTIDDVAPNGVAVELSGGALLGSLREVDPARSWPSPNGGWLIPVHPLTKASQKGVTPGAMTRYDIEVRPIFATLEAGHRLRVRIGTGDLPHLMPPPASLPALLGGIYGIAHGPAALSWIDLSATQ